MNFARSVSADISQRKNLTMKYIFKNNIMEKKKRKQKQENVFSEQKKKMLERIAWENNQT